MVHRRLAPLGLAISILGALAIVAGLVFDVSVAFFAGILAAAGGILLCAAFWGDS